MSLVIQRERKFKMNVFDKDYLEHSLLTQEAIALGLTEEALDSVPVDTSATTHDDVINNIAIKVIKGDFGEGEERKQKLGKYYDEIMELVNEIVKQGSGSGGEEEMAHSDFLMHWGKKKRSGRYPYGSGDRPYQHEGPKARKNTSFFDRRSMSDEDLDKAITRARKESELQRLERDNRSTGQKFVEDVLTSTGKKVLITAGTGALLWAGKQFATKVLDEPELGEYITKFHKNK